MSWVTAIGSAPEQTDYRLVYGHRCAPASFDRIVATPLIQVVREMADRRGVTAEQLLGGGAIAGAYADAIARIGHGDGRLDMSTASQICDAAGLHPAEVFAPADARRLADLNAASAFSEDEDEWPLRWIGDGCREFGIEPGTVLRPEQFPMAHSLMRGTDPHTGQPLLTHKPAADPRSKLPAAPLLEAIRDHARMLGQDPLALIERPRTRATFTQLERQVVRLGESHRARIRDLSRVARACGVELTAVYGADAVAEARHFDGRTVIAGNLGYDVEINIPKDFSAVIALVEDEMADQMRDVFIECVYEGIAALEEWAAYGLRGHQGDGDLARRVESSGFLGWATLHWTARPVDGAAVGDPHLHAHVTLANLCRALEDGRWSTIAGGGRDLYRHVKALDALVQARLREVTARRWGFEWRRNPVTGVWSIVGVPDATIRLFSKRNNQILRLFESWGIPLDACTARQQHAVGNVLKEAKTSSEAVAASPRDLRAYWRQEARRSGHDPEQIVAEVLARNQAPARDVTEPSEEELETLCRWVFRVSDGLTAHRKDFTRAAALTAVMDAIDHGITSHRDGEELTDLVLQHPRYAVPLASAKPSYLSNRKRFTTADIIAAERVILAQTRARYGQGTAVVRPATLQMAIDVHQAGHGPAMKLSDEQRAVLERITRAGHGIDAVVGVPGSGKTTLMEIARAAWEADGMIVAGASTAAVACANLQLETGIRTMTIAGWLNRIQRGPGLTGVDVLIVDEAAMVDDRQKAQLLAHAATTGTKIVGIGDPDQLQSPGVGEASRRSTHSSPGGR
ncbi:hypothetical protein GCM10029978_067880 [Actinoallomurus acanthiterrae]